MDENFCHRFETEGEPLSAPICEHVLHPDKDGNVRFLNKELLQKMVERRAKQTQKVNKIMKRILEHGEGPIILGLTDEEFKRVCNSKSDLPEELSDMPEVLANLNCHPDIIKMSTLAKTERIQKLKLIVEHYTKHVVLFNPKGECESYKEALKYIENDML